MKKISRRNFLTVAGILAASAAMSACSGGSTKPASASSAAASSSTASSAAASASAASDASLYEVTEPITITWWHSLESQYDGLVQDVVAKFNATQDKITVEPLYVGGAGDINEMMVAGNAAGVGLPAVTVSSSKYITAYGEGDVLEVLDPYIEATNYDTADFAKGLLKAGKYQDKQIALPFLHSTQVVVYNKTMAEKYGWTVPDNVNDFGPFLQKVHDEAGIYGTIIPGWDHWYYETLYKNEGLKIITDENTTDLGTETGMWVTELLRNWCNGENAYFAGGPDASSTMRQKFYSGETFSVMHTSSLYDNYVSKCDFEVGMAWYPAGTTGDKNSEVGGVTMCIPRKNDQATKNAAWQFVKFLCGKEVNMQWAENTGYVPTRLSVLTTDEGKAFLEKKPAFQCIFDNLDLINPCCQNSAWAEFTSVWRNYMLTMVSEGGDIAKNSADMTAELDEILEDHL